MVVLKIKPSMSVMPNMDSNRHVLPVEDFQDNQETASDAQTRDRLIRSGILVCSP